MVVVIVGLDLEDTFSVLVAAGAGVIVYLVLIFLMKGFEAAELPFFMRLLQSAPGK